VPGTVSLRRWNKPPKPVRSLSAIPLKGIPQSLLQDAAGVAIIPQARKTALVVDREFGRGVILSHEPTGLWSNPAFVTLKGLGAGGEAGIEKTELVLVFKSRKSLDLALKGKLTLGGDISVAAGPLGRDTEVASDRKLKAGNYAYSRSRGLFVGASIEGARLAVDEAANEAFYHVRGGRATEVLAQKGVPAPAAAQALKEQLLKLTLPPAPAVVAPAQPAPPMIVIPEPFPRPLLWCWPGGLRALA
jgi:lipid-binding SYLF domain-containing protein